MVHCVRKTPRRRWICVGDKRVYGISARSAMLNFEILVLGKFMVISYNLVLQYAVWCMGQRVFGLRYRLNCSTR